MEQSRVLRSGSTYGEDGSRTGTGDTQRGRSEPTATQQVPDEIVVMTEEELNEGIAVAKRGQRMKRKREYLAAVTRGEESTLNPYKFDDPTPQAQQVVEPASQRPRYEGRPGLKLPYLKFKGGSYQALNTFFFDLKTRFITLNEDIRTDQDRIVYASAALEGSIKTRWTSYVTLHFQGDIANLTWPAMEQWLKDSISDSATRSLEAVSKLRRLEQKEGQTFALFLEQYENIEGELGYELPAMYQVSSLLDALRPDLRRQIVSMGIPEDRQGLIASAQRAESLVRSSAPSAVPHLNSRNTSNTPRPFSNRPPYNQTQLSQPQLSQPQQALPAQGQNQNQTTGGLPREAAGASNATYSGGPLTCYRCGKPGHFANVCPDSRCSRCNQMGHTVRNCTAPLLGTNITPIACYAAN
jgi:hypothetical protein